MAASNAKLEQLMSRKDAVGAGEPIDLDNITADYLQQSSGGAFYEPFWDLEAFRDDGQPLDPEGSATYADNPWDRVQLSQHVLPGLWSASATPALKLDIQKPIGYDGAAVITRGYLPAGITLTGLVWTPMQWRLLQEILPQIWRRPNKIAAQDVQLEKKGKISAVEKDQGEIVVEQRSLSILHPALNALGIFFVVVQRPTPLVTHSIPGVKQMTIECLEYVPEPSRKPSAIRKITGQQSRGENAFDKAIKEKDARAPKRPSAHKAALEPGKLGE